LVNVGYLLFDVGYILFFYIVGWETASKVCITVIVFLLFQLRVVMFLSTG
jgi:hypothetical protein